MNEPLDRLLRRDAVQAATGLSKATIYRLIASGDFPAPIKIGLRAVAWPLSSILSWIEAKKSRIIAGNARRDVAFGKRGRNIIPA